MQLKMGGPWRYNQPRRGRFRGKEEARLSCLNPCLGGQFFHEHEEEKNSRSKMEFEKKREGGGI